MATPDAADVPPSTDVSTAYRAVLDSFGPETMAELRKVSLCAAVRLRDAGVSLGADAVSRARAAGAVDADAPQETAPSFDAAPSAIQSAIATFPTTVPPTLSATDAGATLARAAIAAQHVATQLVRGFLTSLSLPPSPGEPFAVLDPISLDRCSVLVGEARATLSYLASLLTNLTATLAARLAAEDPPAAPESPPRAEIVDVYVTSEIVRYSLTRHAALVSQLAAAALVQ